MTWDYNIRVGDLMSAAMLTLVGYGMKRVHQVIKEYLDQQDRNRKTLDTTTRVVDQHSRALIRGRLIDPPIERCDQRRRKTDEQFIHGAD